MKNQLLFYSLLLLFLSISCGKKEETSAPEALRPVRYGQVLSAENATSQRFSGIAQSSKEAQLSFKVNGTINRLQVKVGDNIRTGQAIAILDAQDYNVKYEQAVAQLKSAETQIKTAKTQLITTKSTYDRVEKLYENNSVSLSEFEQTKSALETAQAQHEAALAQVTASQKQVESAQNQVSYARLTAPFSGVVTMVNVEENEFVGAGAPIAILNAIGKPEINVGIPEIFITRIRKGQIVEVGFSTLPNVSFNGTVSEVSFSAAGGTTYPVIISIDNPTDNIRPGMAASVLFRFAGAETASALPVAPIQAIGEGAEGHFVFLLEKNGQSFQVKKQTVEIGNLLPNGFEIKQGLKAGDLVATAGLNSLLPGMRVQLMEE